MTGTNSVIDGGWGWMMVFCGFIVHVLIYGAHYSLGLLYVSWLKEFGENKATTSWIVSIAFALMWTIGPLPAFLMKRFGEKPVQVVGGVLACLGFALASLADSVPLLIGSIGVIGGIGAGFCYLPCVTVIAEYFDKKRGLAFGLATSGVGIGAFLFSPLVAYLEDLYGWRGCMLILAGLELNMCVCGLLVRPAPVVMSQSVVVEAQEDNAPLMVDEETKPVSVTVKDELSFYVKELRDDESSEFHELSKVEDTFDDMSNVSKRNGNSVENKHPLCDINSYQTSTKDVSNMYHEHESVQLSLSDTKWRPSTEHITNMIINDFKSVSTLNMKGELGNSPLRHRSIQSMNIFLQGSVNSLCLLPLKEKEVEAEAEHDGTTTGQIQTSLLDISTRVTNDNPCIKIFKYFGDRCSLFKKSEFLLFMVSTFLTNLSYIMPQLYMVDRALEYDIPKSTGALLISVNGFANLIARLAMGFLSDKVHFDILWLFIGVLTVCGISTTLSVFCRQSFFAHALYSACFGATMGSYNTLFPLVTVELAGLEMIGQAYSILLPISGIACLVGPPFAGWLCDTTGNFDLSFCLYGMAIALSAVFLIPAACCRRRRLVKQNDIL